MKKKYAMEIRRKEKTIFSIDDKGVVRYSDGKKLRICKSSKDIALALASGLEVIAMMNEERKSLKFNES